MKKNFIPIFLFLIALFFTPAFIDAFYSPKVILGGFLLIFILSYYGIENLHNSRLKIPVYVLILYSSIILISNGNHRFLGGNYLGLVMLLLITVIISGTETSGDYTENARLAVILALSAISVYSILQYYGLVGQFTRFKDTIVPYATLGHRNYVADYIILTLPFLIAGIEKKKLFYIPAVLVAVWALYLTHSLRALLGLGMILFLYYLFAGKKFKRIYFVLFMALILASGIYGIINMQRIYSNNIKPRLLMWKVSFDMLKNKPLTGQGAGTFEYNYPEFQLRFFEKEKKLKYAANAQSPQRANNEYLHILAEQGLLGLGMYIWLFYLWFKNRDKKDRSFAFPVMCGISGVLVSGFFGYPLHRPSISFTMAVLMGMSINPIENKVSFKQGKALNFAIVLLCVVFVYFKINEQIMWEKGRRNFESNEFKKAEYHTGKALNYSFIPGKIHFLRGKIFYRKGNYIMALESYSKSLEGYRNRAVYFNRGLVYLKLNKLKEAEEDFKKAIMITPNFKPAYDILIKIHEYADNDLLVQKYQNMLKTLK